MDLYSKKSKSIPQKLILNLSELILIYLVYLILFRDLGNTIYSWMGLPFPEGNYHRRLITFTFTIVVFIRFAFMMFYLLKREMPFEEVFSVTFAFALYYVGFALLTIDSNIPITSIDYLGIFIFLLGSIINTYSELQRNKWKKKPENKGKLYTEGLFKYSMHINYFGDFLWVSGYAIISRNWWSVTIPLFLLGFFVFYNIPKLDDYLESKYGDQFRNYQKRTSRFIPFIY